ncbi:MAG: hypothetical protein HC896_10315 [Bacteroidales bacterium]|nr:hypothetical protein [Bacteroidales bacterium]
MSVEKGDFEKAYDYFKQATGLEQDDSKKADYYYGLGVVAGKLNKLSEARTYALEAAKLKDGWGDPYILIGNLYANSKDVCSGIKLPNSIYWAAADKFIKAKTVDPSIAEKVNSLINTYSQYFPNKEQAFFEGVNEGDAFLVECWINETTKARF